MKQERLYKESVVQNIIHEVEKTTRQAMFDAMCIELYDNFGFANTRLLKLAQSVPDTYEKIQESTDARNPEADALRIMIDRKLSQIFGHDCVPYEERYDSIGLINTVRKPIKHNHKKR